MIKHYHFGKLIKLKDMINDYFDKLICINLDKRKDRLQESWKQWSANNLIVERTSAVEGNPMGWRHVAERDAGINAIKRASWTGAAGCMASHVNIWKRAKAEGWKNVLVIEDDCDFIPDLQRIFAESLEEVPADWDMLYFGGLHEERGGRFIPEKISENILEHKDYLAEEIELAMSNAKITSKNIALSIPVTSAIIRVVTSPLMTDDELQKAIETDSLWENLVQLTDNLNDYSIFHQIINRNTKTNTMEILFVASKLADVNAYSSIAKKAGLNPVIMDVRCFTLKNAHDNTKFKSITDKGNSAILELGIEENYIMIIHNNIPVITDIFLRPQEKEHILDIKSEQLSTEADAVIRRYAIMTLVPERTTDTPPCLGAVGTRAAVQHC